MSLKNALHKIASVQRIWRSSSHAALGEGLEKLIVAHTLGGLAAVESLLVSVSISGSVRANAYTSLARHLMKDGDHDSAAQAAHLAYTSDPKPYRLKWLVFRLYEAGEVVKAKALLDLLPPDTSFSESEARWADRLRNGGKAARKPGGKAAQKPGGKAAQKPGPSQAGTSDLLLKLEELRKQVKSGTDINKRHLKTIGKIRLAPALKGRAPEKELAQNTDASEAPQYIVTLTSYGERLTKTAPYAIASLLAQTEQPDRIMLWVAYGDGSRIFEANTDITAMYAELIAKGVEIRYCEDLKSYKKLIPALREFPDDILITADDDCLYPFDWFAKLKASYLAAPEKIHCHRAHEMLVNGEHQPLAYGSWRKIYPMKYKSWRTRSSADGLAQMPSGAATFPKSVGGVLYPPHSLDARVLGRGQEVPAFLTLCPTAEDIWFWAMAGLAERKYKVVSDGYRENMVIDEKISKRRHATDKQYDEQLASVLKEFPQLQEKALNKIAPSVYPPEFSKQEMRLREKSLRGEKIRVLFIFSEPAFWCADELYRLLASDERFEPIVIVAPEFIHINILSPSEMMRELENGLEYCRRHNYHYTSGYTADGESAFDIGAKFQPDIVVYSRPYPQNYHPYFRPNYLQSALCCYIPYGPIMTDMLCPNASSNVFNSVFHNRLWKYFVTNLTVAEELKQMADKANNKNIAFSTLTTGFPRFDLLQSKAPINDPWKNGNDGKKRIIWAPHHSVGTYGENGATYDGNGCFQLICWTMLSLAKKYRDKIQLAFKPHPVLMYRMSVYLNWTDEQIENYYRQWSELPNGQVETGDYIDLFLTSDAMIHDSISFRVDYLNTGKPQLITDRPMSPENRWNEFGAEVEQNLYHTRNFPAGIEDFIERVVLAGDDPMKAQREEYVARNFRSPFGKSASQNMFDAIVRGLGLSSERFGNDQAGETALKAAVKHDLTYSAYWRWNFISERKRIGSAPQSETDVLHRGLDEEAASHLNNILAKIKKVNAEGIVSIFDVYSSEELRDLANYRGFLREPKQKTAQGGSKFWQWRQYKLPINHFDGRVFCDHMRSGLAAVKNPDYVGNRAIIDADCFIADSALIFRDSFPNNKIILFERNEENRQLASRTVALNNLQNVEIGDYDAMDTLDNYIEQHQLHAGLIRADFQGNGLDFLAGAKQTIERDRPILLISIDEYNDFYGIKPLLEGWDLGYRFDFFKGVDLSVDEGVWMIAEPKYFARKERSL
jgi:hypothetical protein